MKTPITITCAVCKWLKTSVTDQTPGEDPRPPAPGDFWLCERCGQLHRFGIAIGVPLRLIALRCDDSELVDLEEPSRSLLTAARDRIRGTVLS